VQQGPTAVLPGVKRASATVNGAGALIVFHRHLLLLIP